jgi:hypothetical protein
MDSNHQYGLLYHAVTIRSETPVPLKKPFETFGRKNRPKNVSTDGLENASPTRAGNQARIWPGPSLIHMLYQRLKSWRRTMDSNHRYGLLYHAVTIRSETPVPLKNPFETFGRGRRKNRPKNVSTDGLENAPPTRAGNQARIWPGPSLIHM